MNIVVDLCITTILRILTFGHSEEKDLGSSLVMLLGKALMWQTVVACPLTQRDGGNSRPMQHESVRCNRWYQRGQGAI